MKTKNKNWWKAAGIRALKTFVQALVGGGVGALLSEDWKIALLSAILTAVASFCNSLLVNLPEVEPEISESVPPEIENEEIIDTSEEDEKFEGNLLGNLEGDDE